MPNNNMHKAIAIAFAALMIVGTGKAAAEATGNELDLAKSPLFGLNVTPNLLLVLDDSTTMDLEVLFRGTRDGVLYWKPNLLALSGGPDERPTWNYSEGHFVNGFGPQYAFGYLFPNGINNWIRAKDRRTSSGYKAIPPLPAMAFARSPAYNNLYFNPNIEYDPWPGIPAAVANSADPAPGVERELIQQPAIVYPTQGDDNQDNCGGLLGGLLCGIGDLLGSLGSVLDAVGGLVGGLLGGGDQQPDQPPSKKVAIDLTHVRGHFGPGELFTYGSWLPDIPNNREYIGCTTGALLLGLAHEDNVLNSVLSANTIETVFGILFGLLTNVNGLLTGALQAWLGDGLISAITELPELLADLLELVGDSVDNILALLLGVINLILGDTSNADGTGYTDVNSLLGAVDGVVQEVIILVVGLLDVLRIPAPCLNMAWTTSETSGLLTGLVGNVVKEGVVGEITGFTSKIALQYYPATFYMQAGADLPPAYASYKNSAKQQIGYAPDEIPGQDSPSLVRYQIKPENFTNTDDYQTAMQNFANWFSYYRKRHLAMRGALMRALEDFSGLRIGVTTTNQRDQFQMYALGAGDPDGDGTSARAELYEAIRDLEFSSTAGTPNRKALQFAGEQLESNDSIITKSCQPNYAMLVTDGFNSAGVADSVGNADGDNDSVFDDGYDNTIADVAMHYYESLTLDNPFPGSDPPVPTPTACNTANPPLRLDCQTEPHMVTYGMSLGQNGTIFQNTGSNAWPAEPYDNAVAWPDANATAAIDDSANNLYGLVDSLLNDTVYGLLQVLLGEEDASSALAGKIMGPKQIDDLWHATVNARGDMYLARTPKEMTAHFKDMLNDILVGFGGSAASLAASEKRIFQPVFRSSNWTGDLVAYNQNANGIPTSIDWRGSEQIPLPDNRVILTNTASCSDNGGAIAFAITSDSLADCGLSDPEIKYLRGDAGNEVRNGGTFRNRYGHVLGDIVHSDPAFVGVPRRSRYPRQWADALYPDIVESTMPENLAPDYRNFDDSENDFYSQYENRTPVVYVGANDGMLHGFDATTGAEVLAYIPGELLDKVDALTDPAYVHQPYVDGSPITADVVFDDTVATPEWRTVLVGGLRGGGQAVYALDVTDPSTFSAANAADIVLWEFTDPKLGYSYGEPSIVRLHNGEWAAIFGNGYNSGGGAQLFIVDIEDGSLIARIEATAANGSPNGLAQPTPVDVDGDFIVDYVYAGDLQGHLWKFDLTSRNPGDWSTAVSKLFTAEDAEDNAQPITSAPVVGIHPYGRSYGVMVYFGTGRLLEPADGSPGYSNSFYGIWDPNVIGSTVDEKSASVLRADLVEQDIVNTTDANGDTYRVVSDKPVRYSVSDQSDRGWYIDLTDDELVINNPSIRRGVVGFTTALPSPATACSAGGSGFIMRVSAVNGGPTTTPAFDINGDGNLDSSDKQFSVANASTSDPSDTKAVGASGVKVTSGRPSEATHVPGTNTILHNTTGTDIQSAPTPDREGVRRTWRIIRLSN